MISCMCFGMWVVVMNCVWWFCDDFLYELWYVLIAMNCVMRFGIR